MHGEAVRPDLGFRLQGLDRNHRLQSAAFIEVGAGGHNLIKEEEI